MRQKTLLSVFIIILLLPAFGFAQTVIQIAEGDDKIDGALFSASAGDIIELTTDGGIYNESFPAVIDKPLTIRAAAGLVTKPVITCDDRDHIIEIWDDLTLEGVTLNGALGDSVTTKGIRTGDSVDVKWGYNLWIDNCEFLNFSDEVLDDGHAIYANTDTQADTVMITNTLIAHILQESIYFKNAKYAPGSVKYFRMEYSTIWDTGDEAIYVEDHDNDLVTPGPDFFVNHITIHNSTSVDKNIYPKEIDGAIVKNCIITQPEPSDATPVRIYGTSSVAEFILFWNTDDISLKDDATVDHSKLLEWQKPYLEDPDNGKFAVAANSPAALFADDGTALGDTNNGTWDAADITKWEYVENNMFDDLIEDVITEGDTVVFVTSGGKYTSESYLKIEVPSITLMAAPGLEEKPVLKTAPNTGRVVRLYQSNAWVIGLKFEGYGYKIQVEGENTPYGLQFEDETGTNLGTVIVEDCEFTDFRLRGIHCDDNNWVDTLIINNCFFNKIGESGIYNSGGGYNIGYAKITNSTFYKCGQKGMYLRNQGTSPIEVSHCTFFYSDSTLTGRTGNRGVYALNDSAVTVRDNIFAQFADYATLVYGPSPVVEYNLFWLCDSMVKNGDDPGMTFPTFNDKGDPMFADTSEANLNLAIELLSVAVGGASDGSNLGDPRWGTYDATGINGEHVSSPGNYNLNQNYPNPFNPSTLIEFTLAQPGHVSIKVFDILGKEVTNLVNQDMVAGTHSVSWNAKNLAAGIYFYKMTVRDFEKIKKMVLIK